MTIGPVPELFVPTVGVEITVETALPSEPFETVGVDELLTLPEVLPNRPQPPSKNNATSSALRVRNFDTYDTSSSSLLQYINIYFLLWLYYLENKVPCQHS